MTDDQVPMVDKLLPGQFVRVKADGQTSWLTGGVQWMFARYLGVFEGSLIVEDANGRRWVVEEDRVSL